MPRNEKVMIGSEARKKKKTILNSHVEIEYIPPHSTSRLGLKQAKGPGEFIGIYWQAHHSSDVDHFAYLKPGLAIC